MMDAARCNSKKSKTPVATPSSSMTERTLHNRKKAVILDPNHRDSSQERLCNRDEKEATPSVVS